MQLTSFKGPIGGVPSWSPDGKRIAIDMRVTETSDIYTISPEGHQEVQMTSHPGEDVIPTWSRDGTRLYFSSMRSGDREIWSMPALGGEAQQITLHGGIRAIESVDEKAIYYAKTGGQGVPLWRKSLETGEETMLLEHLSNLHAFVVFEQGIYFVAVSENGSEQVIRFHDFRTGQSTDITPVENLSLGFTVSPDQQTFLWARSDPAESDLLLVEDFR